MEQNAELWRDYGLDDISVRKFVHKYRGNSSLNLKGMDIDRDGACINERSCKNHNDLVDFLNTGLDSSTSLRIIAIEELNSEALQILSTTLGIHLGFWSWVTSEQASDGFWLNTHNDGKILSFDLPSFEFYTSKTLPYVKIVREGRLKQLSSVHRFYGEGAQANKYEIYLNRRSSGYLIPGQDYSTLIYISEKCPDISSLPIQANPETTFSLSMDWFIQQVKDTPLEIRMQFIQEPVGMVLHTIRQLLRTWHAFTVQLQRDLEEIDTSLPEDLPTELPEHNLYDIGTYLHRDVVQSIFRFTLQLGKYEGWLKYTSDSTNDKFRPKFFLKDMQWIIANVQELKRRLDGFKERGNMSLMLINNYISLQQARLANQQALISVAMAKTQLADSRSGSRLSIVATIFLPMTFATSWLSTNGTTPIYVFFAVTFGSMMATGIIIVFLKWMESGRDSAPRRAVLSLYRTIAPSRDDEAEMVLEKLTV